jgi:hypothetical protein
MRMHMHRDTAFALILYFAALLRSRPFSLVRLFFCCCFCVALGGGGGASLPCSTASTDNTHQTPHNVPISIHNLVLGPELLRVHPPLGDWYWRRLCGCAVSHVPRRAYLLSTACCAPCSCFATHFLHRRRLGTSQVLIELKGVLGSITQKQSTYDSA